MNLRWKTAAAAGCLGVVLATVPATSAQAKVGPRPDVECLQAGLSTLISAGLLVPVARNGLPIADAVALGVAPREGTDLSQVPDPLPLSVVLRDHLAGDNSLFIYPWCD